MAKESPAEIVSSINKLSVTGISESTICNVSAKVFKLSELLITISAGVSEKAVSDVISVCVTVSSACSKTPKLSTAGVSGAGKIALSESKIALFLFIAACKESSLTIKVSFCAITIW